MKNYRRIRYRIRATRLPQELDNPSTRESFMANLRRNGHRDCEWESQDADDKAAWRLRLPNGIRAKPGQWVVYNQMNILVAMDHEKFRRKFELHSA